MDLYVYVHVHVYGKAVRHTQRNRLVEISTGLLHILNPRAIPYT